MRGFATAFGLLFILSAIAAPGAQAAVTKSCELVPHGFILGFNTNGCSVAEVANTRIVAVVTVMAGTIDAIEIDMQGPTPTARHVFVCTFTVSVSRCVLPAQVNSIFGVWTVTGRIVGADPLGPVLFGGADTYARLDATFY